MKYRTTIQSIRSFVREREVYGNKITLPKPPSKEEILNHNKSIRDQRWIPTEIPVSSETGRFEDLPTPDRIKFLKQELEKRKNGIWFYNNGNLEYMSGTHYFYVTYWKIDIGLPKWRESDRDLFYLWDHIIKDPECFGLVEITRRRDGKTHRGVCMLYEYISKTTEASAGIQSKTRSDASKVFRKMIRSWKKLPDLWKPMDSGESNPSQALKFEEPAKRSTKGGAKEYKKVLNSIIDYGSSTEEHYDGDKLQRYLMDEAGKTVEVNVSERWLIVRECLGVGKRIIGKALITTTVEEMEKKGGKNFKKLWDDSNPEEIKEDGRTVSGLTRYFKPAWFCLESFVDEYGYSVHEDPEKALKGEDGEMITEGSKTYLLKKRKSLTGENLASEKRKFPFYVSDAFIIENSQSVLPVYKVNEQREYNETIPDNWLRKGNLVWRNGDKDSDSAKVDFKDDPNGRWLMSWLPQGHDNAWEWRRNKKYPANTDKYVSGCDPFDHDTTTNDRRSKGCSIVLKKYDPLRPLESNFFCSIYLFRPETRSIFYEDMIKECVFFGKQALIENNKIGLINYFKDRGFHNYLMERPAYLHTARSTKQKEYGIPMSGDVVRDAMIEGLVEYIYKNIGLLDPRIHGQDQDVHGMCYFEELLEDWANFEASKWTDYDSTVASMLAVAASKVVRKDVNRAPAIDLFETYSQKGGQSKRIH